MPIRRTRIIGGERFLKNRHGGSNEIRYSIYLIKNARKDLSDLIKHRDTLIKDVNEEWKKSEKYQARKNTVKHRKSSTSGVVVI